MVRRGGPDDVILLDACVVINLYATRQMGAIVRSLSAGVGVVDLVRAEARHVRRGGGGEDADERDPLDLGPLIDAGALRVAVPTDEELDAFVQLTLHLDDGESLTAAVAMARGWTVATDERKAVRLLAGRVALRSTLDLVKTWAEQGTAGDEVVAAALADLRERGPYLPGRDHPLREWWDSALVVP